MGCRGVYFALTDEEAGKLLAAVGDDSVIEVIQEEIEARWDENWLLETDKAWDAIHRCLTDGSLGCKGKSPLEKVVIGGRQLHRGPNYIVSYLTPDEVREITGLIRGITKDWFCEKYFGLRKRFLGLFLRSEYDGQIDDKDFEYSWNYFEEARKLFEKAAMASRSIVFTVDQ